MCRLNTQDKHIVPTGLKKWLSILFYKHIVPTGLSIHLPPCWGLISFKHSFYTPAAPLGATVVINNTFLLCTTLLETSTFPKTFEKCKNAMYNIHQAENKCVDTKEVTIS